MNDSSGCVGWLAMLVIFAIGILMIASGDPGTQTAGVAFIGADFVIVMIFMAIGKQE